MTSKGFFNAFEDLWMLDGVRTPMVDYCGALGHVSPTDLGIKTARAVLHRARVSAEHIDSVIAGNMAPGDFDQFMLPRHIGLYAGVAVDVPAIMSVTVVIAVFFVLANYLVDALYVYLDPRLRGG